MKRFSYTGSSVFKYSIRLMFLCVIFPAVLLCGCGRKPKVSTSGTTDEMFTDTQYDAKIYAFMYEDRVYTVDSIYEIKTYAAESMKNGGFYKLTADVNYLNGGVAGYVNYPEIKDVSKETINEGISDGVLCCREYFVVPAPDTGDESSGA